MENILPQGQAETVDQLNILLCDELSAVLSYEEAQRRMASPPRLELGENRDSHMRRSVLIADAITAQGQIADSSSAIWGVFGRAIPCSTQPIDRRVAIDDLLEGENRMLAHYGIAHNRVDPRYRRLLATALMPEQVMTRGRINLLWMSGTPPLPLPCAGRLASSHRA